MAGILREITEAGFHRRLLRLLPARHGDLLQLGDDCAALPWDVKRALLLTTDAVGEGTHFPSDAPPRLVGRLAANVNISDLAAKGGRPLGLLSALLLPPETESWWAEEVTRGVEEASRAYRAHLLGGDTKRGERRAIVVTAVGEGERGHLMPRYGAKPGDLLAVTGTIGRGGSTYLSWAHQLGDRNAVLEKLLTVRPRIMEGRALRAHARAALDTSDGLGRSLRLLAAASGISAVVDAEALPLDPSVRRVAARLGRTSLEVALLGGDYELLVAIPPRKVEAARRAVQRAKGILTIIGRATSGPRGSSLLRCGESTTTLPDIGFDAFSQALPKSLAERRR